MKTRSLIPLLDDDTIESRFNEFRGYCGPALETFDHGAVLDLLEGSRRCGRASLIVPSDHLEVMIRCA